MRRRTLRNASYEKAKRGIAESKRTIGVDDGEDIKVVLVHDVLDLSRVGVVVKEIIRNILHSLPQPISAQHNIINAVRQTDRHTMDEIHSRAWTVPCQIIAGLVPEPLEPKMLTPLMLRPPVDVPEVTILALLGKVATRSSRKVKWSAMGWYAFHQALFAKPAIQIRIYQFQVN